MTRTVLRLRREYVETVERQLDAMYRTAFRVLSNRDDAEDAVQDALHKGWRRLDTLAPGRPVKPWLFRILTNACIDRLRARTRVEAMVREGDVDTLGARSDHPPPPGPEETVAASQVTRAVQGAIDRLPLSQRLVVQLVIVEMMSYEEAAEILGLPVGTVRSRLSRARSRLRETLSDHLDGQVPDEIARDPGRLELVTP